MKNIQVIDFADNCTYPICRATDEDFKLLFPGRGQDIEFIEDVVKRLGNRRTGELVQRVTTEYVVKQRLNGLHGTLFFGMVDRKKWSPNKRESDYSRIRHLVGATARPRTKARTARSARQ